MRQLALDLPLRTALGREDFMISDCNAAAVAWIDRWPEWPAAGLVIYGPSGAGKTHLASVWRGASAARPAPEDWRDAAPGDAVLLEDVEERIAGGPKAEETLLHLYNRLREGGGSLLATAKSPPSHWRIGLPDLASRLRALSAIEIGPPDDALLSALVVKLFADRQLVVKQQIVSYLVTRVERSFAALQRSVDRIDRLALEDGRPIGLGLVRRALAMEGPAGDGAP